MSLRRLAAQKRQVEQEAQEQGKRVAIRASHRFPLGTNIADLVDRSELLDVMRGGGLPEGESSRVEGEIPIPGRNATTVVEEVLASSEELEDDAPFVTNRKRQPITGESSRSSK